jgi:hypothetical protein
MAFPHQGKSLKSIAGQRRTNSRLMKDAGPAGLERLIEFRQLPHGRPGPKDDGCLAAAGKTHFTNAYTKKNIQTTSSINMAPINNRGHIRWKIFATKIVGALRTTVGRGRRTASVCALPFLSPYHQIDAAAN